MYYVSRQHYYYSGENVVEVTYGGRDHAGADMLTPVYPGEGEEYNDPREAVAAALEIRDTWRVKYTAKDTSYPQIGCGATGGMGTELEPMTTEAAVAWAEKAYAALPTCSHCGVVLGKRRYKAEDWSGDWQCSENCASVVHEWNERESEEE